MRAALNCLGLGLVLLSGAMWGPGAMAYPQPIAPPPEGVPNRRRGGEGR